MTKSVVVLDYGSGNLRSAQRALQRVGASVEVTADAAAAAAADGLVVPGVINMFGSFPPSPLVVCASKVYSGLGADIVYGIITLKIREKATEKRRLVTCSSVSRPVGVRSIVSLFLCYRERSLVAEYNGAAQEI